MMKKTWHWKHRYQENPVLHHSMDRMIEVDAVFRSPLQPGPTIFLSSDGSDECAASVKLEVKSLLK